MPNGKRIELIVDLQIMVENTRYQRVGLYSTVVLYNKEQFPQSTAKENLNLRDILMYEKFKHIFCVNYSLFSIYPSGLLT